MADKNSSQLSSETRSFERDATLGGIAEAISSSMFRAVAAREEFKDLLSRDDAALVIEPWIRCGGRIFIIKGNVANFVRQTQSEP